MKTALSSNLSVVKCQDKLIEIHEGKEGLKICLFSNKTGEKQCSQISETFLSCYEQIAQFKQYFDSLEHFSQYVKKPQNIKIKEDKLEIYSKHPIKQNLCLKIGELDLTPKQGLENDDFCYINQLCTSEKQLQSHEIKSMLLRVNLELKNMRQQQKTKISNEKALEDKISLVLNPQNKQNGEQVARLHEELESLSKVIGKKLQIMSLQVQNNKRILQQKMNNSNKVINSLDSICQRHVQQQFRQINNKMQSKFQQHEKKSQQHERKLQQFEKKLQKQLNSLNGLHSKLHQKVNQKIEQFDKNIRQQINNMKSRMGQLSHQDSKAKLDSKASERRPKIENKQADNINFHVKLGKLTKISEIEPGQQHIDLRAKIISVSQILGSGVRAIIGDETGIVNAFLPSSLLIKQGNTVFMNDCYAAVVKQHIQLRVPRKTGQVVLSLVPIQNVNMKQNVSDKAWVPLS